MKPNRSEAIILNTFPARERDKLVVFLTPDHGKLKGWAYGARSMKTRFGASLEPLAKVHITWMEKETEEVVRIESIDLIRSLFAVQQKLLPSLAATYLAEHADTFALPSDPNELLYRLLDRSCEALLAGLPAEPVVGWFELWILRLAGIFPSIRQCADCQRPAGQPLRWDEEHEVFLCGDCGTAATRVVPNDVAEAFALVFRSPVEAFAAEPLSREVLFELRAFARHLRRNFLGYELKSHDLLQALM